MGIVEKQLFQILSGYWKALCNLLFLFNEIFFSRTHIGNWNLTCQSCLSDSWLIEPWHINPIRYSYFIHMYMCIYIYIYMYVYIHTYMCIWRSYILNCLGKKLTAVPSPFRDRLPGSAVADHKMKVVIGKKKSCINNCISSSLTNYHLWMIDIFQWVACIFPFNDSGICF